ncbi:MAG: D-aminoacylase, partial [Gemmatimonadetes bacterium]|nr:D-aminoacylase [Gemmatimonadota bacterium]
MNTKPTIRTALVPFLVLIIFPWITGCDGGAGRHDVVIRGGTVYDGLGGAPIVADVAIDDDTVSAIGPAGTLSGSTEIDAEGLAVSPGFVNVLSWATESLLVDGRGQSDIRQGVTLEVMGEGTSMGPLTERMRENRLARQDDLKYDIPWTTFGEYMEHLEARGVSPNVASFVGATTVRIYEIGY